MASIKCKIFEIIVLIFIFDVFQSKASPINKLKYSESKLIVISMDGLMFNQIQSNSMPFISNLYKNGVSCSKMRPVFPTKTLVNHFSIATGLYAGSHGVTANVIYDNKMGKVLKYSSELFMLKRNVTPIWTLNQLSGQHSAVSMWSAGEFLFRGVKPTYYESFNRSVSWKQRIDNLIPELKRDDLQINLVMFYSEHPDFEAHAFSSESKQVFEILKDLDNMVRYLSQQLNENGLSDVTDITILSDHGMDDFRFNRDTIDDSIINLNRIVSKDSCEMYGSSPVLQVIAKEGHNQMELCDKLKRAAKLNGNYNVYTNEEIKLKEHWHIYNERRFGPCTVVADPGYVFQDMTEMLKKWTDYEKLIPGTKFGSHGYDNKSPKMQSVFLAHGPRFRNGVQIPFLQNIDLYYLFARLLNIEHLAAKLDIDAVDQQSIWNQMLRK